MTMRAEDVLRFVALTDNAGIDVWGDGGCGVDALAGPPARNRLET